MTAPDTSLTAMLIYGTRPEAIKMAPLVRAMRDDDRFRPIVVVTGQHREIVERTARGRHDDAAHVQSRQQAHELALAIGIGIGRAQHGDPVVLAQAVLNAAGGLGEEGVGDVVDEHPDQRGAPMAQTPGGLRAHEAELVDRRAHPVQGWSGHALGVVEDVRDRADRDAGPLSDVAHRRMSHGTPPHHAP